MARATSCIVEASSFPSRRLSKMGGIVWSGGGRAGGGGGQLGWLPVEIFRLMGLTKAAPSYYTIIDTIAEFGAAITYLIRLSQ